MYLAKVAATCAWFHRKKGEIIWVYYILFVIVRFHEKKIQSISLTVFYSFGVHELGDKEVDNLNFSDKR